jgi:uridylate kinase
MAKHGVDGVYSADPKLDKNARKYDELTYNDVLRRNLRIIDATAAAHANERKIPAVVFDLNEPDALLRVVQGERVGTLVRSG